MCDNLVRNEWLEILDDGKAYGCSPLGLTYGDIREVSIQEIMSRMRPSELVDKLADHKNLKGKCGICEFSNICSGCRGRAYIYSGDVFSSDPMCAYIPKNIKRQIGDTNFAFFNLISSSYNIVNLVILMDPF